jgi:hypothetical protein
MFRIAGEVENTLAARWSHGIIWQVVDGQTTETVR